MTDDRCCLAGEPPGHPGPCVHECSTCAGDGYCPECGGAGDLGCDLCGGSGGCPEMCDDGELAGDGYPAVVTVDTGGLT